MRAVPVTGVEDEAIEAMRRYSLAHATCASLQREIETAFTFSRSQVNPVADLPPSIFCVRPPEHARTERNPVGTFADARETLSAARSRQLKKAIKVRLPRC